VERGALLLEQDGIHYALTSEGKLCDKVGWIPLDKEDNVWQKCPNENTYEVKWYWPVESNITGTLSGTFEGSPIIFDAPINFLTIDTIVEFDTPQRITKNIIEVSRINLTKETATLRIGIV
jgi:hypothetical protein